MKCQGLIYENNNNKYRQFVAWGISPESDEGKIRRIGSWAVNIFVVRKHDLFPTCACVCMIIILSVSTQVPQCFPDGDNVHK